MPSRLPTSNSNKNEIICIHEMIKVIRQISIETKDYVKHTSMIEDG